MQFEDQSSAMRQMKELLRDQAKFRAKLDRVVRKIETSSQRTAKLAERNKTRKPNSNGAANSKGIKKVGEEPVAIEQNESEKVHGDKLQAFDHEVDGRDGHVHDGEARDGESPDGQHMSADNHEVASAEHR